MSAELVATDWRSAIRFPAWVRILLLANMSRPPTYGTSNGHWSARSGQTCNACCHTCRILTPVHGRGHVLTRIRLTVDYSRLTSSIFQRQGKRINKTGRKLERVGFRCGVLRRASEKCEAPRLLRRTLEIDLHLYADFSYQNWNHVYHSTLQQFERPVHQLLFCFQ